MDTLKRINNKYFIHAKQRDKIFFAQKDKESIFSLKLVSDTSIKRHVKIKAEATPYDPKYKEYFKTREMLQKLRKKETKKPGYHNIALKRLEPCEGKPLRTVLRRANYGNIISLPANSERFS